MSDKKLSKKQQAEKNAKTSIWLTTEFEATALLAKIRHLKINIVVYTQNTVVVLNRDFKPSEYKKLFPSKA